MFRSILKVCAITLAVHIAAQAAPAPSPFDPLVAGVIERLGIGDEVAQAKWLSGKPVSDPARETILLAHVRQQADAAGVSTTRAQQFFRDQMEASKLIQMVLLDRWHRTGHAPAASGADLKTTLRPRLDRLTTTLIGGLRQTEAFAGQADCKRQLGRSATQQAAAAKLDALHRAALSEALRHVCTAPGS